MSLTWNYSSLLQNEFPDHAEETSIPPRSHTSSFVPLQSVPLIALCIFTLDSAASQGGTLSKRTQTPSRTKHLQPSFGNSSWAAYSPFDLLHF